jgi:phage/plasmid-associated DNA primase
MSYLSLILDNDRVSNENSHERFQRGSFDLPQRFETAVCGDMDKIFAEKPEIKKYIYASLNGALYDIACVVHYLYHETYKVTKIKTKTWYVFDGLKWKLSELGPYYKLSSEVVNIYEFCLKDEEQTKKILEDRLMNLTNEENDVHTEKAKNELKKIISNILCFNKIIEKLKNVNTKETICKECIYLFYDPEFNNCLDINPNLICFQNGVLDLQKNKLRYGQRSDNISITINYVYKHPKTNLEKMEFSKMLDNFEKFRKKIVSKRQSRLVFDYSLT